MSLTCRPVRFPCCHGTCACTSRWWRSTAAPMGSTCCAGWSPGWEDGSPLAGGWSARSEDRRVGKECRSRWSQYHYKKKEGGLTLRWLPGADNSGTYDYVTVFSGSTDTVFFFQAEDGIRVFHVTGVQTCALPI